MKWNRLVARLAILALAAGVAANAFSQDLGAIRSQAVLVMTLENGDRVSGFLVAVGTDHVEIENSYAGRISINIDEVRGWQTGDDSLRVMLRSSFPISGADTLPVTTGAEREKNRVLDSRTVTPVIENRAGAALAKTQKADGWKRQVNFGYTITRGNVKSSDANASFNISRGQSGRKVAFNAFGRYGVNNGSESAALFTSLFRYDQAVVRIPVFTETQFEIDRLKKLDYRISQNIGLSLPVMKGETRQLALDLGTGVTREEFETGLTKMSATNLLRLSASQKVNQRTVLSQQATFYTDLSDPGAYRLRAEASLTTPISKHLALRLTGQNRYDARPQGFAKPNDFTLLTGFTFDF